MENPLKLVRGYNNRFTHPMVIYNRLQLFQLPMQGVMPQTIIDLCGELVTEMMQDVENMYFLRINVGFDDGKDKLVVKKRLAAVPSFVARVYRVLDYNEKEINHHDYDYNGSNILLRDDSNNDKPLYIDAYCIPYEPNEMVPLIPRGYEQACFWYCLHMLTMNMSLTGEINQNDVQRIENKYNEAKMNALASTFDVPVTEYLEMLYIAHDVRPDRIKVIKE